MWLCKVQGGQQSDGQPGGDEWLCHRDIVGRVREPCFEQATLAAELLEDQRCRAAQGCAAPTRLGQIGHCESTFPGQATRGGYRERVRSIGEVRAVEPGFGILGWISGREPVDQREIELASAQLLQRGGWVELLELEVHMRMRTGELGYRRR
jgi:hypothetical protein